VTSNTLITDRTGSGYWLGIVVEDGGILEIDGGSTICHASIAVSVNITSAGNVTIDAANFIENKIGITINEYTGGIHPATIVGTTIDGGYPTTLPTGLVDTYGHTGININDVHDGGTPTSLGFQVGSDVAAANTFVNLAVGVEAYNSTFLVQNCDFSNIIEAISPTSDPGVGILAGMKGPVTTCDAFIGVTTAGENTFIDCDHGVDLYEFENVKVGDNTFGEVSGDFQIGIQVRETYNSVVIEDNDISNFSETGVLVEDNGGAAMNIRENTISGTGVGCEEIGIDVVETAGTGSVTYAVRNNEISDVAIGISAINAEDIEISSTNPGTPQEINFTQPSGCSGDLAFGIRIEDCDGALIENNTINGQCSSCTNNEISGIGVRRSVDTYLNGNNVELAGFGILIAQNCEDGNANCNTLDNCRYGFGFQDVGTSGTTEYGPVEYEGSSGEPSDNAWFPASTADRSVSFAGSKADLISWIYRAAGSTPAPGTEHDASIGNAAPTPPATALSPSPVVSSIDLCGATMRLAAGSADHANATAKAIGEASYELVYANYFIGIDSILMDSALSTSIPDFHDMVDSINAKCHMGALASYTSLTPINSMEESIADALFLAAKARHRRFVDSSASRQTLAAYLSEGEQSFLESLAWSSYAENGKAASIAAAILGISTWRIDSVSFRKGGTELLNEADINEGLIISPNPANLAFNVAFPSEVESISLYSLSGNELATYSTLKEASSMNLKTTNLDNGMYIIVGYSGMSDRVFYEKVVVSK
jgi:hypothetical protein